MVTGDAESQDSNNWGANGSNLVATTILHPIVQDLAFAALNKAQNRVLKQAAALKRNADTKFRKKCCCMQAKKRARELELTWVQVTKAWQTPSCFQRWLLCWFIAWSHSWQLFLWRKSLGCQLLVLGYQRKNIGECSICIGRYHGEAYWTHLNYPSRRSSACLRVPPSTSHHHHHTANRGTNHKEGICWQANRIPLPVLLFCQQGS
jgi:hypothetical protein